MNQLLHDSLHAGKRAVIQLLGERNATTVRTYRHFWQQQLQGKHFVFVHTMGKVASSSIVQSLRASSIGDGLAVYHTHSLSPEGIALVRRLFESAHRREHELPLEVRTFLYRHQALSQQLRNVYRLGTRIKLVTVVRDPVATNFSGYFYTSQCWPARLQEAAREGRPGVKKRLARWFLAVYPHDIPLTWFDMEMKNVFGIDVFAQPFPRTQGYQILHSEQADLLVLRIDQLNDCADAAFSEFLGIPHFTLLRANEASDLWYAPLYKEFTSWVTLPTSYLDRMYKSQYTGHFYSDAEATRFRQRWQKAVAAVAPA